MDNNGLFSKLWSAKPTTRQASTKNKHAAPSFKPSLFTNNSLLSSSTSSSFYPGKVQYGGAMSAMRNNLTSPYVVPRVKKVDCRPKHLNHNNSSTSSSAGTLSSTARKILQTLEKMSTPLRDLKKIPPPTLKVSRLFAGRQRKRSIGSDSIENSKRFCPPSTGITSLTQVTVNSSVKLPLDNQLATQSLMKVISGSNENVANASPNIYKGKPGVIASYSSSIGLNLKESSATASKSGGKMKNPRKNHSHYSASITDEKIEEPVLPDVTFTVAKLPSFNFNNPDSTSTPAPPKPLKKHVAADSLELQYTFSPPTATSRVKQKDMKQLKDKVQFSSPLVATNQKAAFSEKKAENSMTSLSKKKPVISGNVMDILGSKNTCATKETSSEKPSLGSMFKKPSDKWECNVCMIMNEKDTDKCAACETPKHDSKTNQPSNNIDSNPTTTKNANSIQSESAFTSNIASFSNSSQSVLFGFGKSAKVSDYKFGVNDTEKNLNTKNDTENSNSGNKSKQNPDKSNLISNDNGNSSKWTCNVCLVPNEKDRNNCIGCENVNPCTSVENASFKFGETSSAVLKFGAVNPKETNMFSTDKVDSKVAISSSESISKSSTSPSLKLDFQTTTTPISKASESKGLPDSCGFQFGNQSVITETSDSSKMKTSYAVTKTSSKSFSFGTSENSKQVGFNAAPLQPPVSSDSGGVLQSNKTVTTSSVQVTTSITASIFTGASTTSFHPSVTNAFSASVSSSAASSTSLMPNSNSGSTAILFGQPSTTSAKPKQAIFSFGDQPAQTVVNLPSQTVTEGAASVSEQQASSLPKPSFSFGSKAHSQTLDNASAKPFAFGGSSNPPEITNNFGSTANKKSEPFGGFVQPTKALQEPKFHSEGSKTQGFSGFGQQTQNSQESKSDLNTVKIPVFGGASQIAPAFGKKSTKSQDSTRTKLPAFGGFGQSTTAFGNQSTKPQDSSTSKLPAFGGFGQSSTASASQPQANFSFGSAVSSASNFSSNSSLPKPSFSFGSSGSDSKPQFGTGTNMFGSAVTATSTTTKPNAGFQFGSSNSNPSQSNAVTPFGAPSQTKSTPVFGFGTNKTSNPPSNFQFGGSQANSSTAGFNFGSSASINKNPAPSAGFSFGGSSDPTAKPAFSGTSNFQFGSNQTQPAMQSRPDSTSIPGFQFTTASASASAFPQAQQQNPPSGTSIFSIGQSGKRTVKQAKRRLRK